MQKVNLYIDGFNLYFGLKKFGHRYKWLDLMKLGRNLCYPNQEIGHVKYFTARIKGTDTGKIRRQTQYLEAIEATGVSITLGNYQGKPVRCRFCGKSYLRYEEKESDVNLATTLLLDAVDQVADVYMVISGDSDLILPMKLAKERYRRRVVPVFPPNRHSQEIVRRIGRPVFVNKALLRQSQLPDEITKADGYKITKPSRWRNTL